MKYITIIRDGHSDYRVLQHFISAIFKQHHRVDLNDDNFFEVTHLSLHDAIAKYIKRADKSSDYTLHSKHARELRNRIGLILESALKHINEYEGVSLSNQDIIVANTDVEKVLNAKQNYFNEWAHTLNDVLWFAIEEFCNRMVNYGYDYENLPLILPLVLFPSPEILVAACMYDFNKENLRTLTATPALKQKVYETDSIPKAIQSGILDEVLSTYVVPDSLKGIYKEIPEARRFMQILSFNSA